MCVCVFATDTLILTFQRQPWEQLIQSYFESPPPTKLWGSHSCTHAHKLGVKRMGALFKKPPVCANMCVPGASTHPDAVYLQSVSRKSVIPGTGCVIPLLSRNISLVAASRDVTRLEISLPAPWPAIIRLYLSGPWFLSRPPVSTCPTVSQKVLANDDQSERLQARSRTHTIAGRLYRLISDRPAITAVTADRERWGLFKATHAAVNLAHGGSWGRHAAYTALRTVTSREAERHSSQTEASEGRRQSSTDWLPSDQMLEQHSAARKLHSVTNTCFNLTKGENFHLFS